MATLQPVILAGGGGTRLWPLSREQYPKQFLALTGEHSLLEATLLRVGGAALAPGGLAAEEVLAPLVVCNEAHRFLVAEQARRAGVTPAAIVLEPCGRNTAPALTAAALRSAPDTLLAMLPADHLITDAEAFARAMGVAARLAADGDMVTFGVVPDRPETGFGYIRRGTALEGAPGAARLAGFVEKPDRATAERYLASGEYLWNSGIFVVRAGRWLELAQALVPEVVAAVRAAVDGGSADADFFRLAADAFAEAPAISVDYAVMERLDEIDGARGAVVALDAGWSDVGSWQGLWEVAERDADDNLVRGDVLVLDGRGNVAHASHRLVAMVGCEDLVVVETADAVLVSPRERAQDVRRVVEHLAESGREERLTHRRVYRPWGSYESVDAGPRFQVKRIVVNPGAALSLQMHHHRAEHWIVVRGTAEVQRGDERFLLTENQSTFIPVGERHRLRNPGTIPLEIIEVQSGPYLGEDDIVRFEDVYNRD